MKEMIKVVPEGSAPYMKKDGVTSGDISGVIGFADKNCKGAVAICFPSRTAVSVYNTRNNENGKKVSRITSEVMDLIGEFANNVAGGVRSELKKNGVTFNLAIPIVVTGKQHKIVRDMDIPAVVVPMKIDGNPFSMEICIEVKGDITENKEKVNA